MRATKKLVSAILALIASIVLCIGGCLAWFSNNERVEVSGVNNQFRGSGIVDFKVTAYYLDALDKDFVNFEKATTGNLDVLGAVKVDGNGDGVLNQNSDDKMRPYTLSSNYSSVVLFKIEYELLPDAEKNYRVYVSCSQDDRLKVNSAGTNSYSSSLSNAVWFANGKVAGETFSPDNDTRTAFVNNSNEKVFKIDLFKGIQPSGEQEGKYNEKGNYADTQYIMMDYDRDRFAYLSSLVLENGGGLSSALNLVGDINFGIEEYDTDEVVTPIKIEFDAEHANAVKTQQVGSDIMTSTWQFVVTYSDGTISTVRAGNSNLKIENVNTSVVGKDKPATVTYTYVGVDQEYKVNCEVPYTVTEKQNVPVTGITLPETLSLTVGDTRTVTATVAPADATDKSITWTSSDSSVVSVDAQGKLTALKAGTATITATTADGGFSDTCTVTVAEPLPAVTGVSLDKDTLKLTVGGSQKLNATITPDGTGEIVSWSSSHDSIAKVSSDGTVTAVAEGTATITATAGGKSATCQVTVNAVSEDTSYTKNGTYTFTRSGGSDNVATAVDGADVSGMFTASGLDSQSEYFYFDNKADSIVIKLKLKTTQNLSISFTGWSSSNGLECTATNATELTDSGLAAFGGSESAQSTQSVTYNVNSDGEVTITVKRTGTIRISKVELVVS